MSTSDAAPWTTTTHDWSTRVDLAHLDTIRRAPDTYAPGGLLHLILEVIAYADDEARDLGRPGTCVVTLHADGSVSVTDDGRGTDTRLDSSGVAIKKPVMATKDLRFFDPPHDVLLPDGQPRRGMSVVSALSLWLLHTNRRHDGAWTQRYDHGVPASDLIPVGTTPQTGTTVSFLVDHTLVPEASATPDKLRELARFPWTSVHVTTG
ncbi:MAG: ATP-binding protein [Actinomycetales bacterium]|nr:ATP-binding protein [Actinomycetales bacterium]